MNGTCNNWAVNKSDEEIMTKDSPALRFVVTFYGLWAAKIWMKCCLCS